MRNEDEYNYCYTHHIVHNKYSDCPDCTYKASQLKKTQKTKPART